MLNDDVAIEDIWILGKFVLNRDKM
jgi:hypothetical protein